jgi:hypothetical protein
MDYRHIITIDVRWGSSNLYTISCGVYTCNHAVSQLQASSLQTQHQRHMSQWWCVSLTARPRRLHLTIERSLTLNILFVCLLQNQNQQTVSRKPPLSFEVLVHSLEQLPQHHHKNQSSHTLNKLPCIFNQ